MADKPILFSGPMVRALLAGTKTQTRRAISAKALGAYYEYDDWCSNVSAGVPSSREWEREFFLERLHIQPGDRLYVREHWRTRARWDDEAPRDMSPDTPIEYVATPTGDSYGRFRQGMHMPRWASRLTLTVTDVRVERLMDITAEDAIAEGVVDTGRRDGAPYSHFTVPGVPGIVIEHEPEPVYAQLWERINGEGSWKANPWIAAYSFTVEHGNIDALAKAA